MRLIPLLLAALIAGCSSSGTMTSKINADKPRSVFIEPFGADYAGYPELYEYAGIALARRGYDAVKTEPAASFRLRSSLVWSLGKIQLGVRLVDASTSQVVYFGECNNPGFGTLLSSSKAMAQCFKDALDNLQ